MKALFEIAEESGIQVEYGRLPENRSLSAPIGGKCYIALDRALEERPREERVSLAHELGHCLTGSFYNLYSPLDIREKHEHRADLWAIRQLVPQRELEAAVAEGLTQLWELAERFQVPEPFMRKAVEYYRSLKET
jgi:Zn-dependent peptidase ImmA (M78 family)